MVRDSWHSKVTESTCAPEERNSPLAEAAELSDVLNRRTPQTPPSHCRAAEVGSVVPVTAETGQ